MYTGVVRGSQMFNWAKPEGVRKEAAFGPYGSLSCFWFFVLHSLPPPFSPLSFPLPPPPILRR